MADVRPPVYRRPRPKGPPAPIWHSSKPAASNMYYAYSQYGLPVASKSSASTNNKPTSTTRPDTSKNTKPKQTGGGTNDRDDVDFDDDYDDHYYSGDFNPFDGPFGEDNSSSEKKDSAKDENHVKERRERKSNDPDKSKNSSENYMANPSKKNYAYSKNKHPKTTTTTTEAPTTKCSTEPKLNYHYHMYMVKQMASGQKKKPSTTKKPKTTSTTTSAYPVYEPYNTVDSYESSQQYQTVKPSNVHTSQMHIPNIAGAYQQQKDPNSDIFYQVVTSSSYIEPSGSYVQMSVNGDTQKIKPTSHFDSDYYNNMLLSKILGINPNAKVMPVENYATESSGTAPLAKYDKVYKNSKSVDASKMFELDQNSNLYVTVGKSSSNNKKQSKGTQKAKVVP